MTARLDICVHFCVCLLLMLHMYLVACVISWYLTRLDLGRHAGYSCGFVLEQLTNLSRLSLHEDTADVLLPSVSPLSRLTRLALVDVAASSMAKLKWLPAQLLELQLSLARLRRTEQLPPGVSWRRWGRMRDTRS
jgi:hypothetical protein